MLILLISHGSWDAASLSPLHTSHVVMDKAWIFPMCLVSALQFHYSAPWQMPVICTMWSLTTWPLYHKDILKQSKAWGTVRPAVSVLPELSQGSQRLLDSGVSVCLSKSAHHSACSAYAGQLAPTDTNIPTHMLGFSGLYLLVNITVLTELYID